MAIVRYEGTCYELRDDETVLEGLLRQGAKVAYSCRRGSCHTCILQCDGETTHSRTVDPDIVRHQHILPCIALATSDLELAPPDASKLAIPAELIARRELGGGVFELGIAPADMRLQSRSTTARARARVCICTMNSPHLLHATRTSATCHA